MKSTLKINVGKFNETVGKAVFSLAAGSGNRRKIDSELYRATSEVVDDVVAHPVSVEILKGPMQEKKGNPVSGYGNLFSFIGFPASATPIADIVRTIYETQFKVSAVTRAGTVTTMKISSPKMSEIWRKTPMPWLDGESWVRGIEEKGISGLGHYLNTRWEGREGRESSGWGVQIKAKLDKRSDRVEPREYVAHIIEEAVKGITKRITQDIIS